MRCAGVGANIAVRSFLIEKYPMKWADQGQNQSRDWLLFIYLNLMVFVVAVNNTAELQHRLQKRCELIYKTIRIFERVRHQ